MKSRDILTEKDPMKETEMMMDYALELIEKAGFVVVKKDDLIKKAGIITAEQLGVVIDKN